MDNVRDLLKDLAMCAGFGLFIGIFVLFAMGGLWASWAAGFAGMLTLLVAHRLFPDADSALGYLAALAVSGGVGGAAWWFVARPAWGLLGAIAAGTAFVIVWVAVELLPDKWPLKKKE